jgi:predicted AlkP superfamily phosphohydrolase/phosphomutase
MPKSPRLVVIGLDSAAPELMFRHLAGHLPNIDRLRLSGHWGPLRSCDPPITVPAWMVATTGLDPGQLGCYGFRNRTDRGYGKMTTATSIVNDEPRLWDYLERAGLQSILVGIPQTYPPKPVNGSLVADFLTPSIKSAYTWPPELANEIATLPGVHPYEFDIENFRTDEPDRLRRDLWRMTRKRFALTRHLAISRPWDFLMMVEIGLDRCQHAFWRDWPDEADSPEEAARIDPKLAILIDYCKLIDEEIGLLLSTIPDPKTVYLVSDHGARTMEGGFAINQWLAQRGDLVFLKPPDRPTRIEHALVDWSRTRAWGDGGYYGRIFLNIAGREPHGTLTPDEAESYGRELVHDLENLVDPEGKPMGNRVLAPSDIYREVRGMAPPDYIAYFSDLRRRSNGLVGLDTLFPVENDTGHDLANHDFLGCWIASGSGIEASEAPEVEATLIDLTATILGHFGLDRPDRIQGRDLIRNATHSGRMT